MKLDRISSPIDSLESKWWYRLPDKIPAASAISRTVVARKPFCAKSSAAVCITSARRVRGAAARRSGWFAVASVGFLRAPAPAGAWPSTRIIAGEGDPT